MVAVDIAEGGRLVLSSGHKLWVNDGLVAARETRAGDLVRLGHSGDVGTVAAVSRVPSIGLFNPHTEHGSIVVDGVTTSCLTDAISEELATSLLRPVKWAYSFTSYMAQTWSSW
jgi:hypothetical protein